MDYFQLIFQFLEFRELAHCESVCKEWEITIRDKLYWKSLCIQTYDNKQYNYFPPLNMMRLPDSEEKIQHKNKKKRYEGEESEKKEKGQIISIFNFLDFLHNPKSNKWKKLFLFMCYLYSRTELSYVFIDKMVDKFIVECASLELANIFYTYFIKFMQHISYFEQLSASKMLAFSLETKKEKGYKINRNNDPFLLAFLEIADVGPQSYIFSLAFNAMQSLLEENFAIRTFTKLYNSKNTKPVAKHAYRRLLAYFGSPLVIADTINIEYKRLYIDCPNLKVTEILKYDKFGASEDLVNKLGLHAVVSYLLGNSDPQGPKELSTKMIEGMLQIVKTHTLPGIRLWILWQIIYNKEFYEFWKSSNETKASVTNLLISALWLPNFVPVKPKHKKCDKVWRLHFVAQQLLISLGQNKELDMALLKEYIDNIIKSVDLNSLKLNTVNLGSQGNTLCWAVHIALQLKLENTERYKELGENLLIDIPDLDDQLRLDILRYCGPYIRKGMNPRWFIELDLKGVEIKYHEDPYFILTTTKLPEEHIKLQKKIEDELTKRENVECKFAKRVDWGPKNYSTMKIKVAPLTILFDLSEVGPYARIIFYEPGTQRVEHIIQTLHEICKENGVWELTQAEIPEIDLYEYEFYPELGPSKLPENSMHSSFFINSLLFYWFSWIH